MPSEIYRSEAGSEVRVVEGQNGRRIVKIDWDWFEEEGCIEAEPFFDTTNPDKPAIVAICGCCEDQVVQVKLDTLDSLAS